MVDLLFLKGGIIRILNDNGRTIGAGFLLTPQLAITCAHVIRNAGVEPGHTVNTRPYLSDLDVEALVEFDSWNLEEDIAFLSFSSIPPISHPLALGSSRNLHTDSFDAISFSARDGREIGSIEGKLREVIEVNDNNEKKRFSLRLISNEIDEGASGTPVIHRKTGLIVGMISHFSDHPSKKAAEFSKTFSDTVLRTGLAIPTETIVSLCPAKEVQIKRTGGETSFPYFDNVIERYSKKVISEFHDYWVRNVDDRKSGVKDRQINLPSGQLFVSRISATQKSQKGIHANPSGTHTNNPLYSSFLLDIYNSVTYLCDQKITYLTGDPGAGKTFALEHMAAYLATQFSSSKDQVPIYIPLSLYQPGEDFLQFIRRNLRSHIESQDYQLLSEYITTLLDNYQVILLLDGLNEVRFASDQSVTNQIISEISQFIMQYSSIRCIISTRNIQNPQFPVIAIQPSHNIKMEELVKIFAPDDSAAIIKNIRNNSPLQILASNPLRLKAICQIYKQGQHEFFPKTIGRLYDEYVNVLEQKAYDQINTVDHPLYNNWRRRISSFARELINQNARWLTLDISENQIELTDKVLSFIEAVGVIKIIGNKISFLHDQLLEYFGALWLFYEITEQGCEAQSFKLACKNKAWDEPIFLLSGLITGDILENLLYKLALIDPFLAVRCVSATSEPLSSHFRNWLTKYLSFCLDYSIDQADAELLKSTLVAIRSLGWEECLYPLIRPDVISQISLRFRNDDLISLFYQAIASTNSTEAFKYILAHMEESLKLNERSNLDVFIDAIIKMNVDEARCFIIEHFFDKRYYKSIAKVIGLNQLTYYQKELQILLLGTSCITDGDARDGFETVVEAIGRAGMTSLIPSLLMVKTRESALNSLLRMNGGQSIIDDYVENWNLQIPLFTNLDDMQVFNLNCSVEIASKWVLILKTMGEKGVEQYFDLLINCIRNEQDFREAEIAADAVAFFRVTKAISAIKERISSSIPIVEDESQISWGKPKEEDRIRFIDHLKVVAEFLESPFSFGIGKCTDEALLHYSKIMWNKFDGKEFPEKDVEMFRLGHSTPNLLQKLAIDGVYHDFDKKLPLLNPYTLYSAKYLINTDWENVSTALLHLLFSTKKYWYDNLYNLWHIADLFILYGKKGDKERSKVIETISPLAFSIDLSLQLVAVDILAELNASELSKDLILFLNDRTWKTAYVIIGALKRLKPDDETYQLLLSRLHSPHASERYFAALAVGELRRSGFEKELLLMQNDPEDWVIKAILCALSNSSVNQNSNDSDLRRQIINFLKTFITAKNGFLRAEASRVIGCLGLQELGDVLLEKLGDPDLRVVEQAIIALGKLRYTAAIDPLITIIRNFETQDDYYPGIISSRPESKISETAAISLARIRSGILLDDIVKQDSPNIDSSTENDQQDKVLEKIKSGSGRNSQKTIILGHMHRGEWSLSEEFNSTVPPYIPEEAVTSSTLHGKTKEELWSIRRYSADPELRRQALIEYTSRISNEDDDIYDDTAEYDPHPAVQIAYRAHMARQLDGYGNVNKIFSSFPHLNLTIAECVKKETPKIVNYIPSSYSPFQLNTDPALILAELFEKDYDLKELISTLFKLVEKGIRNKDILRTLSALVDDDDIPLLIRTIMAQNNYSFDRINFFEAISPLVERRSWGVVPLLIEKQKEIDRETNISVLNCMCRLGVYQYYEQPTHILIDEEKSISTVLKNAVSRVEIGNKSIEAIDQPIKAFFTDDNYPYWYTYANLLCETDASSSRHDWIRIQAEYFGQWNVDHDWLGRGLRKWGIPGLLEFFEELASFHPRMLVDIISALLIKEDIYGRYGNIRSSERNAILQSTSLCTDQEVTAWSESKNYGVRLLAYSLLTHRESKLLYSLAERILTDDYSEILNILLNLTYQGQFPLLYEILDWNAEKEYASLINDHHHTLLLNKIRARLYSTSDNEIINYLDFIKKFQIVELADELIPLLNHNSPEVISATLYTIAKVGTSRHFKNINRFLKSEKASIQNAALIASLTWNTFVEEEVLLTCLNGQDYGIAQTAAVICGLQDTYSALPCIQALIQKVKNDLDQAKKRSNTEHYPLRSSRPTTPPSKPSFFFNDEDLNIPSPDNLNLVIDDEECIEELENENIDSKEPDKNFTEKDSGEDIPDNVADNEISLKDRIERAGLPFSSETINEILAKPEEETYESIGQLTQYLETFYLALVLLQKEDILNSGMQEEPFFSASEFAGVLILSIFRQKKEENYFSRLSDLPCSFIINEISETKVTIRILDKLLSITPWADKQLIQILDSIIVLYSGKEQKEEIRRRLLGNNDDDQNFIDSWLSLIERAETRLKIPISEWVKAETGNSDWHSALKGMKELLRRNEDVHFTFEQVKTLLIYQVANRILENEQFIGENQITDELYIDLSEYWIEVFSGILLLSVYDNNPETIASMFSLNEQECNSLVSSDFYHSFREIARLCTILGAVRSLGENISDLLKMALVDKSEDTNWRILFSQKLEKYFGYDLGIEKKITQQDHTQKEKVNPFLSFIEKLDPFPITTQ